MGGDGTSAPADGKSAKELSRGAIDPGRTSLDITITMLSRRRGAVIGALIILLIYYAAVWAPLIATARPLYLRGYDTKAVASAGNIARLEALALVRALSGGEKRTVAQVRESFSVVRDRLLAYRRGTQGETSARAAAHLETVEGARQSWEQGAPKNPAAEAPHAPETVALMRDAARAMKTDLEAADADFLVRSRWPAFLALSGSDVAFMVLSLAFLAGLPLLRRTRERQRRPRAFLMVLAIPALVAGVTWAIAVDTTQDPTDFHGGIAEGSIVAESVVFAPVAYDLNQNDLEEAVAPPSERHWLGTDETGRDMLCRMLWGGRISLSVGFVAVGIYTLLGIIIGALAGFFGGWVDILISRVIEVVICFPVFMLILVIAAFLSDRTIMGFDPPQLMVIMVIIGVTGWPFVARLVRAEFLKLVSQDFVLAARSLGAGSVGIMSRHVLPNALAPVLVAATFGVASAILVESGLSFLGLGITVPTPSWGGMLYSARGYEQQSTWIFLWPGLSIFTVITCYNLVGEALRDALDPRLRQ